MTEGLYKQPTRSEILELAAAEGHDADIPTNVGSIHGAPSNASPSLPTNRVESAKHLSMELEKDLEKDLEKGHRPGSLSSEDDADEIPEESNPNTVFWDGPDDPQNPMNWPVKKRWGTVIIVSAITFLTPLASSMFAPGVPEVMKTFNSTNEMLEGFMVSVYVLGFAFGPLIIAPLSEMYGRLPLYHSCNCFFIIFTIAAAVASNMEMFIVFRFFMGCTECVSL
jgi:hypothetical protein